MLPFPPLISFPLVLVDKVRSASVEALAVAANLWSREALNVFDVLDKVKLLR